MSPLMQVFANSEFSVVKGIVLTTHVYNVSEWGLELLCKKRTKAP